MVLQCFSFLILINKVVGKVRIDNPLLKAPHCYLTTTILLIETI